MLAIGVALALGFDFVLRLARSQLVDEIGRRLDARYSQKLFEKVMNLPMAERQGSTGAFAKRVSEYENVRDFFASTSVVLIVDIGFMLVFLVLIAVLAGWLVLVPLVGIALTLIAGVQPAKGDGPRRGRRAGGFEPAAFGADRIDRRDRNAQGGARRGPDARALAALCRDVGGDAGTHAAADRGRGQPRLGRAAGDERRRW